MTIFQGWNHCNRVSVPMDVTTEDITKCLIAEIQEGKYSLGELIVPIKFKKICVSKDGDLTEDYFYVRGRKNPLHVIRQNLAIKIAVCCSCCPCSIVEKHHILRQNVPKHQCL